MSDFDKNNSSELRTHTWNEDQPVEDDAFNELNVKAYCLPFIIVLGTAGNSLCFRTLQRSGCSNLPHVLTRSSEKLIKAVSVTSSVFLVSLLPLWSSELGWDIYNRDGWCQMLSLVSMTTNFLSTWYVVGFGVERFVVVYGIRCCGHGGGRRKPRGTIRREGREKVEHRGSEVGVQTVVDPPATELEAFNSKASRRRCSSYDLAFNNRQPIIVGRPFITQLSIIALGVVGVVVYVNITINIGIVEQPDGRTLCRPLLSASAVQRGLDNADLIINVTLPYVATVVLFSLVYARLMLVAKYRIIRHRSSNRGSSPMTSMLEERNGAKDGVRCEMKEFLCRKCVNTIERRRTSTMAILALVAIGLKSPSQIVRLFYNLRDACGYPFMTMNDADFRFLQLLQLFFYASFASTFYVMMTSCKTFRKQYSCTAWCSTNGRLARQSCDADAVNWRRSSVVSINQKVDLLFPLKNIVQSSNNV